MDRPRIRCLVSHPIQYQVPLFRLLAKEADWDFGVWYARGPGRYYDEGFGKTVEWDQDLSSGYSWEVLSNWQVLDRLRHREADILWLHGYSTLRHLAAMLVAKRNGVKVWVRGESWDARCPNDPNPEPLHVDSFSSCLKRGWLLPRVLSNVDVCLAIGLRNKHFYLDHGVPHNKIAWVPYAVDNDWWMVRRINQDQHDYGRVLFVGKLQPWKRPQDILAALPEKCRAVFVGDGSLHSKLETDRSSAVGFVNLNGLAARYNWADVVVVPSEFEPWGLVVNEAMCFGKPVIATEDVGCVPDLRPLTYETGNIRQLRFLIGDAIEHREQYGSVSMRHVEKYSYQQDILGIHEAISKTWA